MKDNPLAGFPYGAAYPPMDPAQFGYPGQAGNALEMAQMYRQLLANGTVAETPVAKSKIELAREYAQEVRQRKGMVVKRIAQSVSSALPTGS